MSYFLVFYSRGVGDEARVKRLEDEGEAIHQLLEAERELAADPSHGVVMLVAESEDDLRQTHSHYFAASVKDLLRDSAVA